MLRKISRVVNMEEEVDACKNLNVVDVFDNLNGTWNK